jgi:hypothetical protein
MRSYTQFSPSQFVVDTPCYQSCWTASTARDCLIKLQNFPTQVSVARALRRLRSATSLESYLFDASDFGMQAIILGRRLENLCNVSVKFKISNALHLGLHDDLANFIEASLDHENTMPTQQPLQNPRMTLNLSNILYRDLHTHEIANIADEIVNQNGSGDMKRINDSFNSWHRNWIARRVSDTHAEENSAFSHPLNFWLLAKLFIVLHFFRNRVLDPRGNGEMQTQEVLTFLGEDTSTSGKIRVQVQIVEWLSRIRRRQAVLPSSGESFLSRVISVG